MTGLLTLVLPMSVPASIAVFGVLTIVTTYVGRRFLRPAPSSAADPNNPLSRLVGHRGEAIAAFDDGDGRVFVDGKEWSAVLESPGVLPKGAKVEVVEVLTGARLRVRAAA